jgi:Tfp pilus assembly protein PilF
MFNAALAENPDSYSALDARAGAYIAKGEHEKALADFNRMIALKP